MIQLLLLVCVVCCGSVVIPLGDEFIVNTNTTGIQNAPSVAVLENGNFVAIWDDDDRSGYGKSVCGQVFGALGNKVGAQFTVRSAYGDGIRSLSSSNVVGTSSGFVVVWRVSNPAAIYGQCLGQAGNKIDAEFIVTNSTNVQSPRVVADESRFVVSWSTSSGVAARRFDASICQPAGAEFTVMATSTSGRRAVVTSIGNGRFLAVATANVGPISRELRLSRFTSTGIIEREWGVDTEGTELLKDRLAEQTPYIASLPGGRFVICWIATYERTEMYCTIFDTTNSSSGKSFAIGETMFDHESESILVLDDSFIVLFSARRFNAAHAGIFVYGQRFTFGGASMSEVFRVDVAEGTRKTNSHAVIVGENKFVVVWHNVSNSGTSRDNVLARRFEVMNASPATTVRPSQQSSLVPMSPTSTLPSTPLPAVIVPPLPQETTTTVNNVGAAENTDDDGGTCFASERSNIDRF